MGGLSPRPLCAQHGLESERDQAQPQADSPYRDSSEGWGTEGEPDLSRDSGQGFVTLFWVYTEQRDKALHGGVRVGVSLLCISAQGLTFSSPRGWESKENQKSCAGGPLQTPSLKSQPFFFFIQHGHHWSLYSIGNTNGPTGEVAFLYSEATEEPHFNTGSGTFLFGAYNTTSSALPLPL